MSLTPSIAVAQSALAPNLIIVTDNSQGDDPAIASRRIYVQDAYGNYLPSGTYTNWSYAQATINLDALTEDVGANIIVQWLNSSNTVLYTYTQIYPLSEFNKQFFYGLLQSIALTPYVTIKAEFWTNLSVLWTNIVGGDNAIAIGADIAAAQNCYNRATDMRLNESKYFIP